MTAVGEALVRGVRGVRWYLRELTGETAYEHYLERHAAGCRHAGADATPPGTAGRAPLSRRQFERLRQERHAVTPGARCC